MPAADGPIYVCWKFRPERLLSGYPDRLRVHGIGLVVQQVKWIKPVAETLYHEVQEATHGNGVDVVVDIVGGEAGEQASRCLRFEGRHVIVGFAAGKPPTLRANHILVKNIEIMGCYWGPCQKLRPQQTKEAFDLLKYWFEQG